MLSLVSFAEMRPGDEGAFRGRSLQVKVKDGCGPVATHYTLYALRIGHHSSNVARSRSE